MCIRDRYNGMTAEKAIYAWIKAEFLMPKKLVFHSTNVYYELMKPSICLLYTSDFDKILSVMRSRGVSVSIILQNLAQLKALFEKQWEDVYKRQVPVRD